MYRQIFIPNEKNNHIPFVIPPEWYGQSVEVIAFPVNVQDKKDLELQQQDTLEERRRNFDRELDKYLVDLSGFKFNRDEANDYE